MRSVADDLRIGPLERVLEMPVSRRIALALSLGDDDLDLFVRTQRTRSGTGPPPPSRETSAWPGPERRGGRRRPMTLLDRVVGLLTLHQVPHALIGAAALAARGIARSTYDIDLLTTDKRVLNAGLWAALGAPEVLVDIRRAGADDPLGGVVRMEAPLERPVDVILGRDAWQTRALERAERPDQGPAIVLSRDLILLKLYAGGAQDIWDVRRAPPAPRRRPADRRCHRRPGCAFPRRCATSGRRLGADAQDPHRLIERTQDQFVAPCPGRKCSRNMMSPVVASHTSKALAERPAARRDRSVGVPEFVKRVRHRAVQRAVEGGHQPFAHPRFQQCGESCAMRWRQRHGQW